MTRRELEAKISRLEGSLEDVMSGEKGYIPLYEFARGSGTGFVAFSLAKIAIEQELDECKRLIAELPRESEFESAKHDYENYGEWNATTKHYIAALAACRPWVIRLKGDSILWEYAGTDGRLHKAMFSSGIEAELYAKGVDAGTKWEVVQWEGGQ